MILVLTAAAEMQALGCPQLNCQGTGLRLPTAGSKGARGLLVLGPCGQHGDVGKCQWELSVTTAKHKLGAAVQGQAAEPLWTLTVCFYSFKHCLLQNRRALHSLGSEVSAGIAGLHLSREEPAQHHHSFTQVKRRCIAVPN